jgi:hypothetical protein
VIPTAWIEAAQQRWDDKIPPRTADDRDGGRRRARRRRPARDRWRYGGWFAPLEAKREVDKTGRLTAAEVVKHRRDRCPVIVDLGGGWGGDALIALKDNGIDVVAFNGVERRHRWRARATASYGFATSAPRRRGVARGARPEPGGRLGVALPPDPS